MPTASNVGGRPAGRWLRRLGIVVLVLAAVEVVAAGLIIAANRVLVKPIERTASFYRGQQAAARRFIGGNRDIWAFDGTLGWTTVGAERLGGRQTYPLDPPTEVVRVSAFGNSFVRGADLPAEQSWLSQLESRFPRLEVMNFGIAAYGTDQSYLQYLNEARARRSHVVIIGLAPDNLRRIVNVYRRFLSAAGPPLTKPRYLVDARGGLTLLPNPLPRQEDLEQLVSNPKIVTGFGRHDYWYEPLVFANPLYDWSAAVRLGTAFVTRIQTAFDRNRLDRKGMVNPGADAFRLELALVGQFAETARADGGLPVVVTLPDRRSIDRELAGKRGWLAPLVDSLRAAGHDVLDLTVPLVEATRAMGADSVFTPGLHYTFAAGTRIADWLGPQLLAREAERRRPR
ncbi:MAG: hypothetical protein IT352_12620 [Gemmatimonadales bacterium]|nr:hypothetical protein [Gemmatimonadales bacterium]